MDALFKCVNPFRICKVCGRAYRLTKIVKTLHVCGLCVNGYREALERQEGYETERVEHGIMQPMSVTENNGHRKVDRR